MLLISLAPNSSSSLIQGCTASYLPAHSKNNTQKLSGMVIPVLPKFIDSRFWYYKTKFQYKTEDIVKFTRRIQRWVDTGISMELTINTAVNPSIKPIIDECMDGFRSKELKGIYYSLTINPNDSTDKEAICESCAN
jgi:ribonucleoside-diphosphate reductase alpha chain